MRKISCYLHPHADLRTEAESRYLASLLAMTSDSPRSAKEKGSLASCFFGLLSLIRGVTSVRGMTGEGAVIMGSAEEGMTSLPVLALGSVTRNRHSTATTTPTPPIANSVFLQPIMLSRMMLSEASPPPRYTPEEKIPLMLPITFFGNISASSV